jgi:hypothetical protein
MNRFFRSVAMIVLWAANGYAQFDSAEVLGLIKDSSGAVLVQTSVTLLNESTGISATTVTDSFGNYHFLNVRAGTYTVTAEQAGFRTFSTTRVVVNVGARKRVDVTMEVGGVTDAVAVVGAAEVLETDRSDHGQVINSQQISQIPLNGRSDRLARHASTTISTGRRFNCRPRTSRMETSAAMRFADRVCGRWMLRCRNR